MDNKKNSIHSHIVCRCKKKRKLLDSLSRVRVIYAFLYITIRGLIKYIIRGCCWQRRLENDMAFTKVVACLDMKHIKNFTDKLTLPNSQQAKREHKIHSAIYWFSGFSSFWFVTFGSHTCFYSCMVILISYVHIVGFHYNRWLCGNAGTTQNQKIPFFFACARPKVFKKRILRAFNWKERVTQRTFRGL